MESFSESTIDSVHQTSALLTFRENCLFYQNDDLLLGKCINCPPWPCKITQFLGYDQQQVQVYKVRFLGCKDYANLETYNLIPITKSKLEKMKKLRGKKIPPSYYLAIRLAEQNIRELKFEAEKDCTKMDRFLRLYCSDKNTANNFIDVEKMNYDDNERYGFRKDIGKVGKVYEIVDQTKVRNVELTYKKYCDLSVEIVQNKEQKRFDSVMIQGGNYMKSFFRKQNSNQTKIPKQKRQNFITIDIKPWKNLKNPHQ